MAHLNDQTLDTFQTARRVKIEKLIVEPVVKKANITLQSNPEKIKFMYGNYRNYYGSRRSGAIKDSEAVNGDKESETVKDERLKCIDIDWIKNKRILDIGCNSGAISIELAQYFNVSSVVGVDIDPNLVASARFALQKARSRAKLLHDRSVDWNYFPVSCSTIFNHIPILNDPDAPDILSNVSFRCGDWVHEPQELQEKFQVIFALSISKWIHLNNGDQGIRRFFRRVYDSLDEGGLFILEPQSFEGYGKRAGLSCEMRDHYMSIKFFPDDFLPFLINKIGFTLLDTRHPPHASNGFQRDLHILQKN